MFKIHRKNRCGLDVHKKWIYACIGVTDSNGRTEYMEARFSSFSRGLRELASWLSYSLFWLPADGLFAFLFPTVAVLYTVSNLLLLIMVE